MSSWTACSLVRNTRTRTANPRRPRPPRSASSGACVPTPCAGSAGPKPKRQRKRMAPKPVRNRPKRRIDSGASRSPPAQAGGLFLLSCFPATENKSHRTRSGFQRIRILRRFSVSATKKPRLLPATVAAFVFSGRSRERVPAFLFAPSLSLGVRGVRL